MSRRGIVVALQAGAVALVAALLALLAWRLVHAGRGADFVKAIAAGKKPAAPSFELPLIWRGTGELSSDDLKGRPAVVNFWASWCGPCRDEAPLLASASRRYRDVVFLGIDGQDLVSDARGFLRRYRVPYRSVHDDGRKTYDAWGVTGFPETYYLDRRGRAVAHTVGQLSRDSLEAGITAARAAAPAD